jgi:hypothetical protein
VVARAKAVGELMIRSTAFLCDGGNTLRAMPTRRSISSPFRFTIGRDPSSRPVRGPNDGPGRLFDILPELSAPTILVAEESSRTGLAPNLQLCYPSSMTDGPNPPGMVGPSPSERGLSAVPSDPAIHAQRVAREWEDVAESYVKRRMKEQGIPHDMIGAGDAYRGIPPRAFVADERTGGSITTGITINSGCLNPDLLKGGKGGRLWPKARPQDRIDAIIAHEWEESKTVDHVAALKAGAKTELPVTEGARRILKAMAR